jgi:hypothetical protein
MSRTELDKIKSVMAALHELYHELQEWNYCKIAELFKGHYCPQPNVAKQRLVRLGIIEERKWHPGTKYRWIYHGEIENSDSIGSFRDLAEKYLSRSYIPVRTKPNPEKEFVPVMYEDLQEVSIPELEGIPQPDTSEAKPVPEPEPKPMIEQTPVDKVIENFNKTGHIHFNGDYIPPPTLEPFTDEQLKAELVARGWTVHAYKNLIL